MMKAILFLLFSSLLLPLAPASADDYGNSLASETYGSVGFRTPTETRLRFLTAYDMEALREDGSGPGGITISNSTDCRVPGSCGTATIWNGVSAVDINGGNNTVDTSIDTDDTDQSVQSGTFQCNNCVPVGGTP